MNTLEKLLPKLMTTAIQSYLPAETAIQTIRDNRGIIPISILPTQGYQVVWLDVGDYQFSEWKFRYSIKNLVENRSVNQSFTTDIELLRSDNIVKNYFIPTGFIFQMSLCGSTLLAKALAKSPDHFVLNEGSPLHEPLWQYLTDNWQHPVPPTAENRDLIRNLILSIGRQRIPNQNAYFIKFRSWNVIFIDAIMQAFPNTPCLFLYRDPTEVLVSALQKHPKGYLRFKDTAAGAFMTGHSVNDVTQMSYLNYFTSLYTSYFSSILTSSYQNIVYLNYNQLTKQNFPEILQQAFHYTTTCDEMALMQDQFNYYSKDDSQETRFVSDQAQKQQAATPEIRQATEYKLGSLYDQLEQSEKKLIFSSYKKLSN